MSIIQGVIASMVSGGGGPPPGPVQFDGGYFGDTNIWIMNGSTVGAGTQGNVTNPDYTYPDGTTGKTLNFDGSGFLYSPNLASIANTWGTNEFTIDCWFYPTAGNVQLLYELGQADDTTGFTYSMLEINSNLTVNAKLWNGTSTTSTTKVILNQWNHVWFTEDNQGGHSFAVNGVSKNGNPTYTREKPAPGVEYFGIGGSSPTYMNTTGRFQGKVGWLEIHDYVVASTFDSRKDKFRPAPLAISLDAGNINSYDSGNNLYWLDTIQSNNFTLYGSTLPTYSADNGGYLTFNTANGNYAQAPSLSSANRWTVETWHYYDSTYTGDTPSIVTEIVANSQLNYYIGPGNSGMPNITAGSFNGSFHETPPQTLTANNWYHIVGSYDGATFKLYINGTLAQSQADATITPLTSGAGIRLMARWDSLDLWGGRLSIVRIYTGALNATSIAANYNAERGRFLTQQTRVALAYGQNTGYASNQGGNQISVLIADYPTIVDVPNGATVTITGNGSGTFTVDGSYTQSGIRFFTVGTLDFTAWGSDTLTFTWYA